MIKTLIIIVIINGMVGCGHGWSRYCLSKTVIEISKDRSQFKMGGMDNISNDLPVSGIITPDGDGGIMKVTNSNFDKVEIGQILGRVKFMENGKSILVIDESKDGHIFSK